MKNRLEELRNAKKWTQQELADHLLVSRQTVISLEQGRYNPSLLLAFRISSVFGLSIENIFINEEDATDEK